MASTFRWALIVAVVAWLSYTIVSEVYLERELQAVEMPKAGPYRGKAPVLLFDGVCNLCNGVINGLIEIDRTELFRFAALQSPIAEEMLADHQIPNDLTTVVLIDHGRPFVRSTAALRVAKHLGMPYSLLYYAAIGIPEPIRDLGYTAVGESRYFVFGKQNECLMPSPELQARFLDFTFSASDLEDCDLQTTSLASEQ